MTVKRCKSNIKAKAYINELSKPTVKSETNQKVAAARVESRWCSHVSEWRAIFTLARVFFLLN